MEKRLQSIAEAAEQYGLNSVQLYRLITDGTIPAGVAVRVGRRVFVHRDRFADWIESGGGAFAGGWRRESVEAAG